MMAPDPRFNAGPQLLRGIWAEAGVAVLFVLLRVIAKLRLRQFKLDDIVMILALALIMTGSALVTVGIHDGFGRDLDTLPTHRWPALVMYYSLSTAFCIAGVSLARCAFILFLIPPLSLRRLYTVTFWAMLGLEIVMNAMNIVFIFLRCPKKGANYWLVEADCWSVLVQEKYSYFTGAFNTFVDLFLAVFPSVIFWTLRVKLKVKISITGLLALGLFVAVASLLKTLALRDLTHPSSKQTAQINIVRWSYIEGYLATIAASIPCIRSLIVSCVKKVMSRSVSDPFELSSPRKTTMEWSSGLSASRMRGSGHYRMHKQKSSGSTENILETGQVGCTRSRQADEDVAGAGVSMGIMKKVHVTVSAAEPTASDDGMTRW